MTPQEALHLLNDMEFADKYQGREEYTEMLILCKDALVKQIPKKPLYIRDVDVVYFDWQCPHCTREYHKSTIGVNHCPDCGQLIDWSDET